MKKRYSRGESTRKSTRRSNRRKTMKGGATPYYSFGSAVASEAPYAAKVVSHETVPEVRPGTLASANAGSGGLPGMTGGARRRRARSGLAAWMRSTRKRFMKYFGGRRSGGRRQSGGRYSSNGYAGGRRQSGGRYTMDTAAAVGGTNVFLPVSRIPCEGSIPNTLNPGPHTISSQPMVLRGGGKSRSRKQRGGVGGIDSAAYYAPTAGYSNQPSSWVSSTGTPSLLQTPYDARAMNPACLKTGGGKRHRKH